MRTEDARIPENYTMFTAKTLSFGKDWIPVRKRRRMRRTAPMPGNKKETAAAISFESLLNQLATCVYT
jgi:hypothetical protein